MATPPPWPSLSELPAKLRPGEDSFKQCSKSFGESIMFLIFRVRGNQNEQTDNRTSCRGSSPTSRHDSSLNVIDQAAAFMISFRWLIPLTQSSLASAQWALPPAGIWQVAALAS